MSDRQTTRDEDKTFPAPRAAASRLRASENRNGEHREHRAADKVARERTDAETKLQRIQELWAELARTKPKTLQYEILLKNIRNLSGEYDALLRAPAKSQQPTD
jgi:hypothetical protein